MSSALENRLLDMRTKIQENVARVRSNQLQCQRLSARVDQLVDPLERLEHATSLFLRQETRPILDGFLQCLDDCNTFIEKFSSSCTYSATEISEEEKDTELFEELNKRLSQFGQDLSLGISIESIFNQKQDQTDLIERTNQIIQEQQEQHQRIDTIIQRRFQSLCKYFDQKDLTERKTLSDQQHQFLRIPLQDLRINEKPIGRGGFADVYRGIWLTQHDQIALKVLRLNHLTRDFYNEIAMIYRIRYEHVVTFLGACIEPNFYAMIFEYMPLGSLYDVLHGRKDILTLSWSDRYSLAWQMAKSINYLHNLQPCIIHRDIKSMNFLLKYNASSRHRFLLKVCDFGLAEIRREYLLQTTVNEIVGSLAWKAPELLSTDGKHTKQSDVFSLGMTMWELATGKKPWEAYTDESVVATLVKIGERPEILEDVPEQFKTAVENAWNQNPLERPSCWNLMERMCKQMTRLREKEEFLAATAADSHYQPTAHADSTSTAISVVEEDGRLTENLSSVIVFNRQESGEESSSDDEQYKSMASDNAFTTLPLQRSMSKSIEELSSNDNPIQESPRSRSSINLHRSIIGRTIPSPYETRHQSIIKKDSDSPPRVYRF